MTIADVCKLSDEVRSGQLLISVFLDQAILNPNSKEADRDFILRATYPTAPLRSLLEHIAQKLSGAHPKGAAVVCGTYGSGKSHALLALYHSVSAGKNAQATLKSWGLKAKLPAEVRVAAVQLRSERPDTLWELLFDRADRSDLNKKVRDYPRRNEWADLGQQAPTLLIVDELEDWFAAQDAKEEARTKDALANMLEAAELPDVPLAVALAVYGTNDELMAIINCSQPPIWDVGTAEDRQKIVRHRLIDDLDRAKAKQVVRGYIETYEKVRSELPSFSNLADLRKEMEESYPFHPDFLRQAYGVYAAMPRHESTRGVVGVCATLLRRWATQRDLILAGDLDITDEAISSDLRKLDPDLIQNATEDLRERCSDIPEAAGVVATILFHSFTPHGAPGATEEDVLVGTLRPGSNINDLRKGLPEVLDQAGFIDEMNGRFLATKDVVLVKQIDHTARAQVQTPEGKKRGAEYLRGLIREALNVDHLTLYPDEPLPPSSSGAALKYIVSLAPLGDEDAREILKGLDNTSLLLAPKTNLRERITADNEFLLRALRVLVCEEMLRQRGKRQAEVRNLKTRYERELKQSVHGVYARWMRLSRTNDLGQDPKFVVRPVECELSAKSVEEKLREQYDIDTMRDGMAKLLRYQGKAATKGSDQAGFTLVQLRQGLRRERGLPVLARATEENFNKALRHMVEDQGENGAVMQAGKVLYGYEETSLPSSLSDDWRVWLKPYAPEPPAKEDVKQQVRQELARVREEELRLQELKHLIRRETGVAADEIARAIVELVNSREAVIEQGEERYPDDGLLGVGSLSNEGRAWLFDQAPPDDRKARSRILELVRDAGEGGITWGQVQGHLSAEGIALKAINRAVDRLMSDPGIGMEICDTEGQSLVREGSLLLDADVLRMRKKPPVTEAWEPFTLFIPRYRLPMSVDLLLAEFPAKLAQGCRIRQVTFVACPIDPATDPVFASDESSRHLAQTQVEHRLVWHFAQPISKEALQNLVTRLIHSVKGKGELTVEVTITGEVPGHAD